MYAQWLTPEDDDEEDDDGVCRRCGFDHSGKLRPPKEDTEGNKDFPPPLPPPDDGEY